MDPISIVVAALAAGAVAGVKDSASTAVKDAYTGLKELAARRLSRRPRGELVLTEHAEDPQAWEKPLAKELAAADAAADRDLVTAAQAFLSLIDEAGSRSGKYSVVAQNSQGVAVGDYIHQDNVFHNER
jgi:prophage tail gpP-like protein